MIMLGLYTKNEQREYGIYLLFVAMNISKYRTIHACTWTHPDGKADNQTDHILINRRWHSSVPDV
jgi:hypothetical protein